MPIVKGQLGNVNNSTGFIDTYYSCLVLIHKSSLFSAGRGFPGSKQPTFEIRGPGH